jgi:GT2 family glycosyltransferase
MSAKKVSVSIASYNNRTIIGECIVSVLGQTHPGIEIVLVDNASTDGTADFVSENFPGVRVLRNGSNELFCKAQNSGIRASSGEYVLVLNSDAVLDSRFVEEALNPMEARPDVGSVTGRILRKGGGVIDTTGLFLGRDRRPVDRGYGEPDDGRYMEPGYVFGAGGVAPLYRRDMLEDVSIDGEYFDENYGAFYEDLDLAWRAAARGWKAWYAPAAVAWHMRGATARTAAPGRGLMRRYALARLPDSLKSRLVVNRYLTMVKNDTPGGFLLNLPFIAFYDLRLWFYLLLFSPRAIPGVAKGLGLMGDAWRKRGLTHVG